METQAYYGYKPHILNVLKQSDKPLKKRELMEKFPHLTERVIRKIIEQLILDGELIEASESGYGMIKDYGQLRRARQYLTEKIEALSIRKNTLEKNWKIQHQDKPELLLF